MEFIGEAKQLFPVFLRTLGPQAFKIRFRNFLNQIIDNLAILGFGSSQCGLLFLKRSPKIPPPKNGLFKTHMITATFKLLTAQAPVPVFPFVSCFGEQVPKSLDNPLFCQFDSFGGGLGGHMFLNSALNAIAKTPLTWLQKLVLGNNILFGDDFADKSVGQFFEFVFFIASQLVEPFLERFLSDSGERRFHDTGRTIGLFRSDGNRGMTCALELLAQVIVRVHFKIRIRKSAYLERKDK